MRATLIITMLLTAICHAASRAADDPAAVVLWPDGTAQLAELKQDKGRLRPSQRAWHEKAARLGIPVVVLHGAAEVKEWLDAQGRC